MKKNISSRIPETLYLKLESIAKEHNTTLYKIVEHALQEYVIQQDNAKEITLKSIVFQLAKLNDKIFLDNKVEGIDSI